MCGVWRHRFVVPTQFPVWGALLAGGLLGECTCERLLIGAVDCTEMPCQLAVPVREGCWVSGPAANCWLLAAACALHFRLSVARVSLCSGLGFQLLGLA